MNLTNNTILITGGASGIGLGLTKRLAAHNQVIVCGRRADVLAAAKAETPSLQTIVCDIALQSDRERLAKQVTHEFSKLNVLINNAGIQNRSPPLTQPQAWEPHANEIAINLEAPIHLSMLLLPLLLRQPSAAVLNVSSGLAFVPIAFMPTYCATKAALHSFTMSLRRQLRETSVQVVEVVPPMVNTDLGGKGLHDTGTPLNEYIDSVMAQLATDSVEFGFGFSEKARAASRAELDGIFANMNK